MKAKNFLNSDDSKLINRSAFAKAMYGDNTTAVGKLAHKLNGDRNWLDSDEKAALRVLGELKVIIDGLVIRVPD